MTQTGFDESLFNTKDKKSRYIDTLNMLLDMDILIHSSFFIGTYTCLLYTSIVMVKIVALTYALMPSLFFGAEFFI